jgi:hypothetical protein
VSLSRGVSPVNTPVRIILYIIVVGVIGWFVWRFYIEPKVHTATAPAVETTPAPTGVRPPAVPEPETTPAAAVDAPAQPEKQSAP